MVRTVDLFREFPTTLITLFNTCILCSDFEAQFFDRELQNELRNTPSLTKPRTTTPTITDWIYDTHQIIPNTSSHKGVYTRMKFYKIKESHDDKQTKLTPVTETQQYWFYNKSSKQYCTDKSIKLSNTDSTVYSYALVLPQSSISNQPIFRIEVSLKIYAINANKTRIDIKLKVECCIKAWGVSGFVERFLMNSAKNTYTNWLAFAHAKVMEIKDKKEIISVTVKEDKHEQKSETEMDVIIEDKAVEIVQKQKQIQKIGISMVSNQGNVVQKRNNNNGSPVQVHSIDIGNDIGNDTGLNMDLSKTENGALMFEDNSRGLHKRSVPLRVKVCRCGTRVCPSIFLRKNKKNNIDLMVDSRCRYVEKSLWCVIVVCCAMIILLTLHRYNSN